MTYIIGSVRCEFKLNPDVVRECPGWKWRTSSHRIQVTHAVSHMQAAITSTRKVSALHIALKDITSWTAVKSVLNGKRGGEGAEASGRAGAGQLAQLGCAASQWTPAGGTLPVLVPVLVLVLYVTTALILVRTVNTSYCTEASTTSPQLVAGSSSSKSSSSTSTSTIVPVLVLHARWLHLHRCYLVLVLYK
jgi:hypothetical protein